MNRPLAISALVAASVLVLVGCSAPASDDGTATVVASTNVYGSLAAQIGGDRVTVTSLIDSVAKDPHSYEASARDRLAVQKADLVIENGGGYDVFMTELLQGSEATVITAAEFSHDYPDATVAEDEHSESHDGHDHIEGFNEHVWFDVHTITHVVEQITADLGELDPDGAAEFEANAAALVDDLSAIEGDLDALHQTFEGAPVFITEPLPGLLAAAVGLDDAAPEGFASAVEEGNDVSPAVLLEALELIESREVRAVLTTAQTGGAETERIIEAAEKADLPVIEFSELLGADQTYADWMRAAIDDLTAGLAE